MIASDMMKIERDENFSIVKYENSPFPVKEENNSYSKFDKFKRIWDDCLTKDERKTEGLKHFFDSIIDNISLICDACDLISKVGLEFIEGPKKMKEIGTKILDIIMDAYIARIKENNLTENVKQYVNYHSKNKIHAIILKLVIVRAFEDFYRPKMTKDEFCEKHFDDYRSDPYIYKFYLQVNLLLTLCPSNGNKGYMIDFSTRNLEGLKRNGKLVQYANGSKRKPSTTARYETFEKLVDGYNEYKKLPENVRPRGRPKNSKNKVDVVDLCFKEAAKVGCGNPNFVNETRELVLKRRGEEAIVATPLLINCIGSNGDFSDNNNFVDPDLKWQNIDGVIGFKRDRCDGESSGMNNFPAPDIPAVRSSHVEQKKKRKIIKYLKNAELKEFPFEVYSDISIPPWVFIDFDSPPK